MKKIKQVKKPIIWSISGSDCSGGAGISADIKTGQSLQVETCHLITANTVQNSKEVISVNPVSTDILDQQYETLLFDKPPKAIKIGLIANQEQVVWLISKLAEIHKIFPNTKVIYDPVGQASVGGKLNELTSSDLKSLFAYIDVITPNIHEALSLAQVTSSKSNNINIASLAEKIHALGVNSVIIKGGHTDDIKEAIVDKEQVHQAFDYCLHKLTDNDSSKNSVEETIEYGVSSTRVKTYYSHGGGCSFSSSLAAFSAYGYLLRDALTLTKAFIQQGLMSTNNQHDIYGAFEQTCWPTTPAFFPKIQSPLTNKYQHLLPFRTLDLAQDESLGLYPVIDSIEWLKRLLPLNINIIQLRIKNIPEDAVEVMLKEAITLASKYKTRLIINDYWQLAIKLGAYGVHIGQEDLVDADLTKIQQAGLRLGISTHGCYEFLLAQQLKPSYLAVGAIFPTRTKNMTGQIQGIKNLEDILALKKDIPIVAIGGINLDKAVDVWKTGVDSIAVVTGITQEPDPELVVRMYQSLMK